MTATQVSQISEEKRGGPYTKQEQEQRRTKVYELYFEKGSSALKISEMLDVNRNTVNSDIKYWYTQMKAQIGENVGAIVLKEIERLEIQRKRLLEQAENQTEFASKIVLEKLVFEIDTKIAGFAAKMSGQNIKVDKYEITEEISDEELVELVRYFIFGAGHLYPESIPEEMILQDTIRFQKCDIEHAKNVVNTMKKLGLELCKSLVDSHSYDMLMFASLREYVTKDELRDHLKKRQDEEKRQKEIEEKYQKKYGKDTSRWPDGVEDLMEKELPPDSFIERRYGL